MTLLRVPQSSKSSAVVLVILLALCLGVGAIGGAITAQGLPGWYETIAKPPFTPPDAVFAPVWSSLYILMAVSAWRIWRTKADSGVRLLALGLFACQLVLNSLWSFLFFGVHRPDLALADIVVMGLVIAAMIRVFRGLDPWAAWLSVPLFLWVAFATVLNAAIVAMN